MASGVPVIAADAGGPREIVENGVTGWLAPARDVRRLSELMVGGLAADRQKIGAAARRVAVERFSADRYAADVAAILRSLVPVVR
jgi:glycosyltransferase involved in cell wall biosynthesis